jgi:hypothetical protein
MRLRKTVLAAAVAVAAVGATMLNPSGSVASVGPTDRDLGVAGVGR